MSLSVTPHLAAIVTALTVSYLAAPPTTYAQIKWMNEAGGFYETRANWSAGRAPHSNEQIFFGQPGEYPVDFLAGHTVAGMVVTSQARPTFGSPQPVDRTLIVEGDIAVSLGAALTLGSLDGEGKMHVDNSGYDFVLNGFASDEQAGTLSLRGGSVLTSRAGIIGQTRDFIGRLSMSGEQTAWNTAELTIGSHGDAVVNMEAGASLTSTELANVAQQVGSAAIINVSGVDANGSPSTWTNHGNETVISHSGGDTKINIFGGAVATLSPTGTVDLANGSNSVATVRLSGTDAMGNPSSLTTGDLSVSVFGGSSDFIIEDGAQLRSGQTELGNFGMATVSLTGTAQDGNPTRWTADSISLPDGSIEIDGGGRLDVLGELRVWDIGTLKLNEGVVSAKRINVTASPGITLSSGSTLEFNRYQGDLLNSVGTISPGIDSDTSTISGDFLQQLGGTLLLEVGGTSGRHDAVGIAGVAEFGGSLQIDLSDGFVPSSSDTFPILSAASVIGVFENVSNGERLSTVNGNGSFVVNYGAASTFDADRIVLSDFVALAENIIGDFNNDGVLDAIDIDLLGGAIDSSNVLYDLTSDGLVDHQDQEMWVTDLKNTYFGDANLDGEFNSGDFVQVFQRGEYEDAILGNSGWADGDWNGDGDFNSGDFVLAFQSGGYEMGPRASIVASSASVASVPEPSSAILSLAGLACLSIRRRK